MPFFARTFGTLTVIGPIPVCTALEMIAAADHGGAAIGGALPSTRREDEAFGSYRDQLFTEAQRVYEEERSRLAEVARDTADEAKAQARDLADTVKEDVRHAAGDVRDKARDAVENVADTARKDAKEKGVGSSIS